LAGLARLAEKTPLRTAEKLCLAHASRASAAGPRPKTTPATQQSKPCAARRTCGTKMTAMQRLYSSASRSTVQKNLIWDREFRLYFRVRKMHDARELIPSLSQTQNADAVRCTIILHFHLCFAHVLNFISFPPHFTAICVHRFVENVHRCWLLFCIFGPMMYSGIRLTTVSDRTARNPKYGSKPDEKILTTDICMSLYSSS